jgi:hypothetical protein
MVGHRVAAEPDPRVVAERGEQTLPGLLLLLVVQRPQRGDQVGGAAVTPDHGRIVGRPPVQDGGDRRVVAQFRRHGGDRALRAGRVERGAQPHQRQDAACRVLAGRPHDARPRPGAARAADIEAARLELLADAGPHRRRDRRDHQDQPEQPPRAAVDQLSEPGKHRLPPDPRRTDPGLRSSQTSGAAVPRRRGGPHRGRARQPPHRRREDKAGASPRRREQAA